MYLSLCKILVHTNKSDFMCTGNHMGKLHWLPIIVSYTEFGFQHPFVQILAIGIYVCFIDAFSRHTCIYLLMNKSPVFQAFLKLKAMIEVQISFRIKTLQTDNGKECFPNAFVQFLQSSGIAHRIPYPIPLYIHINKMVILKENTNT